MVWKDDLKVYVTVALMVVWLANGSDAHHQQRPDQPIDLFSRRLYGTSKHKREFCKLYNCDNQDVHERANDMKKLTKAIVNLWMMLPPTAAATTQSKGKMTRFGKNKSKVEPLICINHFLCQIQSRNVHAIDEKAKLDVAAHELKRPNSKPIIIVFKSTTNQVSKYIMTL